MNILLMAEAYPPEPIVGAFRIQKLAKTFAERGHNVTVVVVMAGGSTKSDIGGVYLEVVPASPSPREILLRVREKLRPGKSGRDERNAKPAMEPVAGALPTGSAGGAFRNFYAAALNLPDPRQGVIPALLTGVKNVRSRGPFDLVYSSAPAFSVHLAARRVARQMDIPWFVEFRDPWRTNGVNRAAELSPLVDRIDRHLEASCLRAARAIVAVSESAGATFRAKVPATTPVLVALNGIEGVVQERTLTAPRERLQIVYSGSLYAPRDPRPLLEGIARCTTGANMPVPEFIFVGHCNEYDGESLDHFARRIGIGDHFRMIPWMPQAEARAIVDGADLVLLPAQKWIEQIPNKLFDYLGSRVPVLAIADSHSETAKLLLSVGGHFVTDGSDPNAVDAVVREALLAARERRLSGDPELLDRMTVRRQFAALADTVEELMRK